jgi:hypothetical protein
MSQGAISVTVRALTVLAILVLGHPLAYADAVVGKITEVTGQAQVQRGNSTLQAKADMPVELHDQLKTGSPGEITLQMIDNSILTVNESSALTIDENIISGGVRSTTKVALIKGTVQSVVTAVARTAAPSFQVSTPNAIAGVRGTKFTCRYTAGKARSGFANCFEFTDCATTSGTVVVSNNPPRPGQTVAVGPGQKTTVACLAAPLAATTGTIGVLGASAGSAGGLGAAAVAGAGLGAAGAIGGTTAAVVETTGGGGGGGASGGGTVSATK